MTSLTPDDIRAIRAANARHYAEERARDARRLAAYERENLAAWAEIDGRAA
jgi:hypothetical protein